MCRGRHSSHTCRDRHSGINIRRTSKSPGIDIRHITKIPTNISGPTAQDLYNECLRVMKRNRGRNKAEGMDSKSFQSDSKRIQSDSKRIQSDSKRIQSDSKRIQSDSKILKASQYIGQESQGSSRPTTTHASLTQESIAQGSIAQGSIAQDPYHRDLWDLSVENKGYM
eukprot:1071749-Amorphochlora_amoeboformis.AAC.1